MKISKNSKGIGWEKENDINIDGGNIDLSSYAKKKDIPTKTSQLENDSNFTSRNDMPMENSVKMIAHRGFSSEAPENTLVAYKLAGMRGYWGAECDIQQTSDGHFILMHDGTVDRTTNGTGTVSEMTLEQIKALTVKIKPGYSEPVPTLEEYLICCKQYNLVPVIEVKSSINIANFIQIIRDYDMENKAIVISFFNETLINLRNLSSKIKIQTLSFVSIEHCLQYNFDIDVNYQNEWVTKENIKIAHNNNIEVNVWTVDDLTARNSLIARGVDYITTNVLNTDVCEGNRLYKVEQTSLSAVEKASLNLLSSMKLGQSDLEPIRVNEFMFTVSARRNGEYNNVGTRTAKIVSKPIATLGCYYYKVEFDNTLCTVTLHPRNKNNVQIADLGWFSSNNIYKLPSDTTHFFIYCGRPDDSETPFTDEEIDRIKSSIKITRMNSSSGNSTIYTPSNIRYVSEHPAIDAIGTDIGRTDNSNRCFTNTKYYLNSSRVRVNFDSSLIKLTVATVSATNERLKDIGWLKDNTEYDLPDGAAWFYMYFAPVGASSFNDEQKQAVLNATVTSIVINAVSVYQSREDDNLTTNDKTVVGAINELNSKISFNSSGELVVTIGGISKIFTPKQ